MNHEEARLILRVRRCNGADDEVPLVRAALEQAARDPLLGAELAREARRDATLGRALGRVTPPPDLRAQLLAGAAAQAAAAAPAPGWARLGGWRGRGALALAASLVVAAGWATWMVVRPGLTAPAWSGDTAENLAALRAWAGADSTRLHASSVHASALGAFGARLEDPAQGLMTAELPADFAAWQEKGCREVALGGRDLLVVCFRRDRWYHLYVTRRDGIAAEGALAASGVTVEQHGAVAVASWTRGELVYTLAAEGRSAELLTVL